MKYFYLLFLLYNFLLLFNKIFVFIYFTAVLPTKATMFDHQRQQQQQCLFVYIYFCVRAEGVLLSGSFAVSIFIKHSFICLCCWWSNIVAFVAETVANKININILLNNNKQNI